LITSQAIILINIYAPDNNKKNENYFIELAEYLNTIKKHYSEETHLIIMEELDLVDTYKAFHPEKRKFI
jgi:hypothetical protein